MTSTGLQGMLNYSGRWRFKCNPDRYVVLCFHPKWCKEYLMFYFSLGDYEIKPSTSVKHLGITRSTDLSCASEIDISSQKARISCFSIVVMGSQLINPLTVC